MPYKLQYKLFFAMYIVSCLQAITLGAIGVAAAAEFYDRTGKVWKLLPLAVKYESLLLMRWPESLSSSVGNCCWRCCCHLSG